jgi:hypothetical protein
MAHLDFLIPAVSEVDHHAMEIDGGSLHGDLDASEVSPRGGHDDLVVIDPIGDCSLTEQHPIRSLRPSAARGASQCGQQHDPLGHRPQNRHVGSSLLNAMARS